MASIALQTRTQACLRPGRTTSGPCAASHRHIRRTPAACGFNSQVYGPLTPAGACMTAGPPGPPPPPLPINVDFCADPSSRPANVTWGNDTGLLGVRTGISCIPISDTIKQYRTWCHAWVEQYPGLTGYCIGANNTSTPCGAGIYNVQRQFFSIDKIAGNKYNLCVHVENQDHGRTLHFIMDGAALSATKLRHRLRTK